MGLAVDRISILPESLIEHIVERLPTKERVRTSILSTKWRFLWTQLPSLVLNRQFHHSCCSSPYIPPNDYQCIINSIVLQRTRQARDVSLFLPCDMGMYVIMGFDHLIKCFLRNGVERLFIEKNGDHGSSAPYCVPSSVFSTGIYSAVNLTHLKLHNCLFKPPQSFQGFPSLLCFELQSFQATADVISKFVSSCPTLQKLVLHYLNFPDQTLDIDAPQLRHLSVHGKFKWVFLIHVETIEILCIDMDVLPNPWEGMPTIISNYFSGMAKLKKITLGGGFLELLSLHCDSLTLANYDRLRSLAFVRLRSVKELQFVMNLIWRFPKLTDLTISLNENVQNSNVAIAGEVKNGDHVYYDLKHLLRVDFQHITGTNVEMKLIERLLGCSPALELMTIKFSTRIRAQQILKCFRELILFPRSSILAKVDISEFDLNRSGYYY